jgi:hypothetical protein
LISEQNLWKLKTHRERRKGPKVNQGLLINENYNPVLEELKKGKLAIPQVMTLFIKYN